MSQRKSYPELVARGEVPPAEPPQMESKGPVREGLIWLAEVLGGAAILAVAAVYAGLTIVLPILLLGEPWGIVVAVIAWSPLPVMVIAWWWG